MLPDLVASNPLISATTLRCRQAIRVAGSLSIVSALVGRLLWRPSCPQILVPFSTA
jgi:hypothetical protein